MAEILGNRFVLRYGYLAQMRQNRGHMSAISTIRNLGPATEAQFAKAGITSAEELRALGPDAAYRAWLLSDLPAHFIGYYVLVMAFQDRPLKDCKGEEKKAQELTRGFKDKLQGMKEKSLAFRRRPRVYFEEWDHPRLSCIGWVSELIEACGGENIFKAKSGPMAMGRKVTDEEIIAANPEIIFGCWCGKAVKTDAIASRAGYESVAAVQKKFIWELPPAIFLQPGPALFVDGLDQMFETIAKVADTLD